MEVSSAETSNCSGATERRPGFSLVELLVVISIIALIVAISMPAIGRARESGRDAQCKSNLRQLGFGLIQYGDSHNTLCSGAWDWKHDGCPTETGWVADLVQRGTPVDQLRCPSNTVQLHEQFESLLTTDPWNNKCANSLGSNARLIDGVWTDNLCRQLAAKSNPVDRVPLLEMMLEDGFNTNYVATWLLVRSDVRLTETGGLQAGTSGCPPSLLNRASTAGPMTRAHIGMSKLSATVIPLLACAQPGDISDAVLSQGIGPYGSGIRLSEGTTDGPADRATMKLPQTSGTGMSAWGPVWSRTLQDYRDFGAVHGGRSCNVLFLDMSVGSFTDENADGYLNNGFAANSQYTDDTIELPAARIYSGWSIQPGRIVKTR